MSTEGKVHWGFTMSLDGFVAGKDHDMNWMTGFTGDAAAAQAMMESTAPSWPVATATTASWFHRSDLLARLHRSAV